MDPVEVRFRGRSHVLVARGGRIGDAVGFRWGFSPAAVTVAQCGDLPTPGRWIRT